MRSNGKIIVKVNVIPVNWIPVNKVTLLHQIIFSIDPTAENYPINSNFCYIALIFGSYISGNLKNIVIYCV